MNGQIYLSYWKYFSRIYSIRTILCICKLFNVKKFKIKLLGAYQLASGQPVVRSAFTLDFAIMTNSNTMAVPPSNSPGLIRLRLPSQASINPVPPTRPSPESSPQLFALEQSLRQLIQNLLETAIMVHDLEEGSGELLFQKMYFFSQMLSHF